MFDERGFERIIRAIRFQQSKHDQHVASRQPFEEDREGTIRSYITKQIEVLRDAPGGPFLYGDLTRQVPKTFLTEEIVRVIEQMRLDGIIDFDGPFTPHSTVIRLRARWDSIQSPELRRLLAETEQALELQEPIIAFAGAKFAFERIVWSLDAEYEESGKNSENSRLRNFLYVVDKLGLSRPEARRCYESCYPPPPTKPPIRGTFNLHLSEDGHWHIVIVGGKTDEECEKEAIFVLDYLAKFLLRVQEAYPDTFQKLKIGVPLTEQRVWKERRQR